MAALEQIVLEDIRSKIQLVETDEAEARAAFLKRCDLVSSEEAMWDRKRTSQILRRTAELDKLISSVYEDKVSGKIPEDICVGLLEKYQAEKLKLQNERSEIEKRQADTTKERAKPPVNAPCAPTEPHPEPVPRKIRKSGTGCLYQINDNLWEGSFFPRLPGGKRKKFNVYAETKEQCEIKLAEMIERVKAEIAEEKAKLKEGDS